MFYAIHVWGNDLPIDALTGKVRTFPDLFASEGLSLTGSVADEGVWFDAGEMKESERCNWILALEGEQIFGRATNV